MGPESYKPQIFREQEVHLAQCMGSGHWGTPPRPYVHSAHTDSVPALRMLRGPVNSVAHPHGLILYVNTSPTRVGTSEGIRNEVLHLPGGLAQGCVHLVGDVFHFIMHVCALTCMPVCTHVFPHVGVLTEYHPIMSLPSLNGSKVPKCPILTWPMEQCTVCGPASSCILMSSLGTVPHPTWSTLTSILAP